MANDSLEIPDDKMRVWDADQKKVILVPKPPTVDCLTLTLRLHDPKEKRDPHQSACWTVVQVPREDVNLPVAEFMAKHIQPHLVHLKQLKLQ